MASHGRRRKRESLSLVVALVLHALAVVGGGYWLKLRPPATAQRTVATVADDAIELDLTDAPLGGPAAPGEPLPRTPDEGAVARAAGHSGRARAAGPVPPRAEATEESPPEAVAMAELEPTPSGSSAAPSQAREGPIDLGIGPDGWQRWVGVLPNEPAAPSREARGRPVVRAPPASSTGGLQEGLEAHDRSLGIGPAGRVASALFEAAHDAAAPETGSALFNVTVLRSGVVEVSLDSSSNRRWQSVAALAAEALRKSPPRIPPPREGYRLTLRITAEETMPNGLKRAQLHGARIEATPPGFKDVKTAQREAQLKNPTLGVGPDRQEVQGSPMVVELPGVYVTGQGKTCGYRVGISPLGLLLQGGCDPSNAGAKLQRIVRTEVRSQSAF